MRLSGVDLALRFIHEILTTLGRWLPHRRAKRGRFLSGHYGSFGRTTKDAGCPEPDQPPPAGASRRPTFHRVVELRLIGNPINPRATQVATQEERFRLIF